MKKIFKRHMKNIQIFGIQNLKLKLIYTLVALFLIALAVFYFAYEPKGTLNKTNFSGSEESVSENNSSVGNPENIENVEEGRGSGLAIEDGNEEETDFGIFGDETLDSSFPQSCQVQIRDSKEDLTKLYAFRDEAQAELDIVQEEYDRALGNVKEAQEDIEEEKEELEEIRENCERTGSPW